MNNKGRGSGLALIMMLIVALIVAWLVMTQMGGFGFGKTEEQQEQMQEQAVDSAQDAVDALNQKMEEAVQTDE